MPDLEQVSPSQDGKGGAQSSLGSTRGSLGMWDLQPLPLPSRAVPLKHFRGVWERNEGMRAGVWFALEPSQKNHNCPWGAPGPRAKNSLRKQGWMELVLIPWVDVSGCHWEVPPLWGHVAVLKVVLHLSSPWWLSSTERS